MPRAKLILDERDLAAALGHSCRHLPALLRDLIERAPVAVEHGLLPGVLLPAPDYAIDVLGVELHAVTDASRLLGCHQRCPAAKEAVVKRLTRQCVVQDRPTHNFHRLVGRMIELLFLLRTAEDELRRRAGPDGRILARLPVPGSVLLADEPTRLMLKPVQRSCEHRALLVPDDLLVVDEADTQEPREHLACELGGVPDVADLQEREKREGFRPIGAWD